MRVLVNGLQQVTTVAMDNGRRSIRVRCHDDESVHVVPHERVSRGGRTYVHLCVREVYRMLYRRQFIEVDASALSWLKAEDSGRDAGEGLAFFDEESDGDDDGGDGEEAAGEC